jgi:hypothetical protein
VSSSVAGRSKIKRTGVVSPDGGGCGEILHVHVVLEPEWGALDMGQRSGIDECDERMGQFLPQQQAEETQQSLPWPLCASNDAPGTRERSSESANAQAFLVVFMPHFFIPAMRRIVKRYDDLLSDFANRVR